MESRPTFYSAFGSESIPVLVQDVRDTWGGERGEKLGGSLAAQGLVRPDVLVVVFPGARGVLQPGQLQRPVIPRLREAKREQRNERPGEGEQQGEGRVQGQWPNGEDLTIVLVAAILAPLAPPGGIAGATTATPIPGT